MYECVYANVYVSVPVNLYAHVVCIYMCKSCFEMSVLKALTSSNASSMPLTLDKYHSPSGPCGSS